MDRQTPRLAFLLQGPIQRSVNGYSTVGLLEALNASRLRSRFDVVSVMWEDEQPAAAEAVRALVDHVVIARKPPTHGAGNRDLQSTAVATGLDALEGRGYTHVLKSRHDFLLSDRMIAEVVARADAGFDRIFTTNLFTRRETFHISDMCLFSTFENVRAWYDPRTVYYQDLYSPEVQFARCFVRNKRLAYHFTQVDYLRFLRDWVELIDWTESGLVWFKSPAMSRATINAAPEVIRDRDSGAFMHRLLPGDYPARLRGHRGEFRLEARAFAHRLADVLYTFLLAASERAGRLAFPDGPRYYTVALPGELALDVKIGFDPRRYHTYAVDPYSSEMEKPIGRELTMDRRNPTTSDDDADRGAEVRWAPAKIRGPFGVKLRRRQIGQIPARS